MTPDQNETNFLDLPDEEIMGMSSPPAPAAPPPVAETPPEKTPEELEAERLAAEQAAAAATPAEPDAAATPPDPETNPEAEPTKVDEPNPLEAADDAPPPPEGKKAEPAKDEAPPAAKPPGEKPESEQVKAGEAGKDTNPNPDSNKPDDKNQPPAPKAEPTAEDHKAFYDRLLGQPIKANGKEIQLRSPEEAERLIQMGLNYTKKMQAWQPRMRVVTMLENNGLLDEAKLAHLIDLSKGDPGAIQKLLADSKFDPHTADADQAASYKPGNHQVSDAEMNFNAVLDDLESTDTGVELIQDVSKQWDEQSKQAVFQDPSILRTINDQKSLGLYDRIVSEMDHLKNLGHLQGVPFLQAYRAVGDMLNDQGRLRPEAPKQPEVPVETRVATPAPKVTNDTKAAAASSTKTTPTTPKTEVNYLDVPDDQFLKEFQGRV